MDLLEMKCLYRYVFFLECSDKYALSMTGMTNSLNLVHFSRRTQWHYVTANSCLPVGYKSYFQGNNSQSQELNDGLRTSPLGPCSYPLPEHPVGGEAPEQFWNCAEGTCVRACDDVRTLSNNYWFSPMNCPPQSRFYLKRIMRLKRQHQALWQHPHDVVQSASTVFAPLMPAPSSTIVSMEWWLVVLLRAPKDIFSTKRNKSVTCHLVCLPVMSTSVVAISHLQLLLPLSLP
jgi:hypothetical protein